MSLTVHPYFWERQKLFDSIRNFE